MIHVYLSYWGGSSPASGPHSEDTFTSTGIVVVNGSEHVSYDITDNRRRTKPRKVEQEQKL